MFEWYRSAFAKEKSRRSGFVASAADASLEPRLMLDGGGDGSDGGSGSGSGGGSGSGSGSGSGGSSVSAFGSVTIDHAYSGSGIAFAAPVASSDPFMALLHSDIPFNVTTESNVARHIVINASGEPPFTMENVGPGGFSFPYTFSTADAADGPVSLSVHQISV